MENNKKQQHYSRPTNSKNIQTSDSKRKTDLQASKPAFPRGARRRDQQPTINSRSDQLRNSKQLPGKQRVYVDKRPRARGGGGSSENSGNSYNCYIAEHGIACLEDEEPPTAGAGLVDDGYTDGITDANNFQMSNNVAGKRKNLNHLLNFQYAPREKADYASGGGLHGVFGSYGNAASGKRQQQTHKYNKEQFLQANFQFVIKSSAKPHLITSPDTIVDWSLIEQINIQTNEEPRCPICLYPPVAAKLTRCGHAFCWPCILHYLALNDKSWRKCPICYEAIHVADLKSTAILQQCQFKITDEITFQLMCRKKGSFFMEKFSPSNNVVTVERYPQYSGNSDLKSFSKFLLAKRSDIFTIIERERAELLADEDTTCPEYVFVQQALNLLNERREHLGEIQLNSKDDEEQNNVENENMNILTELKEDSYREPVQDTDTKDGLELSKGCLLEPTSDCIALNAAQPKHHYFFYQSIDGQNIFLHPLNVKMLQACYGSLENAPLTINARILQKECHTMDEELRRKFTCIGHLPLTSQFAIVEVDLQKPIVTPETLILFKDDIKQRQMERERRDREEKKREKKIAAINDRQMGKLISKAANINLTSALEFPVCGFDYDLMPALGAPNNSVSSSAAKNIEIKPIETPSAANISGTPPGPSYSAVILSNDAASKMESSAGLFPELSIRGKAKKTNVNTSTMTKAPIATSPIAISPNEHDTEDQLKSIGTTFGDVMAQAVVRKKATTNFIREIPMTTVVGKKHKREKKKMLPLVP